MFMGVCREFKAGGKEVSYKRRIRLSGFRTSNFVFSKPWHTYIANTYALRLAHITKEKIVLPGGGEIERNKKRASTPVCWKFWCKTLPIPAFTHGQVKEALYA